MKFFINAKFGTTDANALQNAHNHLVKLDVIYWTSQAIMSKMTGATVICLTTGTTHFTIVQYTHARIKQTSNLRLIALVRGLRRNFHHRAAFNLLRREDAELDANDGLDIRSSLIETGWHSVLDIETVV
jgi:hypothetical protein